MLSATDQTGTSAPFLETDQAEPTLSSGPSLFVRKICSFAVSRADLLIALGLSLVHFVICVKFARYGLMDFGADGMQLKTALDIAEGGVVFRDTWSQYGVFTHYGHAVLLLLFGKTLLAIKYYTCFIYFLMTFAQYYVHRHFLPRFLSVVSVVAWIGLASHFAYGIIPWPHVDSVLFQLISLLCLFRFIDGKGSRYLVYAGILTGLTWAAKQSVGAYHFAGLFAFVTLVSMIGQGRPEGQGRLAFVRSGLLAFWKQATPFVLGFMGVLMAVVSFLACTSALHDWWLQTIVFPRAYYLNYYLALMPSSHITIKLLGDPEHYGPIRQSLTILSAWYQQSVHSTWEPACGRQWILIWLFSALLGLRGLVQRDKEGQTWMLMALVATTSWLGTIPSMHWMHQWWTLTPVFVMLPYFIWMNFKFLSPPMRWCATMGMLAFLLMFPVCSNCSHDLRRARGCEVHDIPALKNMRTDPDSAATLQKLYGAIRAYQQVNPEAKVTTLDTEPLTLLILPCFEQNGHFHPIYWSCPVLTDTVYADYNQAAKNYLRVHQPLVVASDAANVKQSISLENAGYRRVFQVKEGNVSPFSLYAPASAILPETWHDGTDASRSPRASAK